MRTSLLLTLLSFHGTSAFMPVVGLKPVAAPLAPCAVTMRAERDSRSKSREQLLPDIFKALDEVALFIAKADASRQRRAAAPSADDIDAYVAHVQRKIDLLKAEADVLREAEKAGVKSDAKVRWTDIDGNDYNDGVWLQ